MSRSTPTKCVMRPVWISERRNRARRRKRRAVLAAALQRAAPDAFRHDLGGNVPAHVIHARLDEIGEVQRRQLLARVAERAQEGRVRVLEGSVGPRDQDQVAGVLGRRGEQLQPRVRPLQFGALPASRSVTMPRPMTVVRLVRNSRIESTVLTTRLEVEHAVADERNQERRAGRAGQLTAPHGDRRSPVPVAATLAPRPPPRRSRATAQSTRGRGGCRPDTRRARSPDWWPGAARIRCRRRPPVEGRSSASRSRARTRPPPPSQRAAAAG